LHTFVIETSQTAGSLRPSTFKSRHYDRELAGASSGGHR